MKSQGPSRERSAFSYRDIRNDIGWYKGTFQFLCFLSWQASLINDVESLGDEYATSFATVRVRMITDRVGARYGGCSSFSNRRFMSSRVNRAWRRNQRDSLPQGRKGDVRGDIMRSSRSATTYMEYTLDSGSSPCSRASWRVGTNASPPSSPSARHKKGVRSKSQYGNSRFAK